MKQGKWKRLILVYPPNESKGVIQDLSKNSLAVQLANLPTVLGKLLLLYLESLL